MNKVSIIIPIFITNQSLFAMTKKCLDQVKSTPHVGEIIVVDDCSPEQKFVKFLKNKFFPELKWIHNPKNLGFSHSVNRGMANAEYDLIMLLNNDIEFYNDRWLKLLIDYMEDNDLDITSIDKGCLNANHEYIPKNIRGSYTGVVFDYLVAWGLLMKKKVIEEIGLFPTIFGRGFFEDTLYSRIIQKSKRFKMQAAKDIGGINLKHFEHTTFKSIGINLLEEYEKKHKLYVAAINGAIEIELPTIDDYLNENKFNNMIKNHEL